MVGVAASIVTHGRKTFTCGCLELEVLAVLVLETVGERVEAEVAREGHGNDEIRGGDERVGSWVGVVAASEVAVVRRNDRVGLA